MELYVWGKLRNFMELHNGSDGTEQLRFAVSSIGYWQT